MIQKILNTFKEKRISPQNSDCISNTNTMESKSEENIESFDANKVLPTNVSLKSVDNHLFRIGLSFNHYTNDESRKNRHFFFNPILINCVFLTQVIKSIVNLIILDPKLVIWTGDFPRALGFRIHFNIIFILATLMSISSSLIWYYNYINGNNLEHIRLFQVMSGQSAPKNLDLNDEGEIKTLINRTKILIKVAHLNSGLVSLFALLLLLGCVTKASLMERILFVLPNVMHLGSYCYHAVNFASNHALNCYITCVYIRNKIKRLNENLLENKNEFLKLRFSRH